MSFIESLFSGNPGPSMQYILNRKRSVKIIIIWKDMKERWQTEYNMYVYYIAGIKDAGWFSCETQVRICAFSNKWWPLNIWGRSPDFHDISFFWGGGESSDQFISWKHSVKFFPSFFFFLHASIWLMVEPLSCLNHWKKGLDIQAKF